MIRILRYIVLNWILDLAIAVHPAGPAKILFLNCVKWYAERAEQI